MFFHFSSYCPSLNLIWTSCDSNLTNDPAIVSSLRAGIINWIFKQLNSKMGRATFCIENDTKLFKNTLNFFRVTKCDFYKYGPSGDIQNVDVMCVLPQNMYSEKFFVVFWFWFIGLACCTVVNFIFTFLRLTKEPLKIIFISVITNVMMQLFLIQNWHKRNERMGR